jgi:signal peptidase I
MAEIAHVPGPEPTEAFQPHAGSVALLQSLLSIVVIAVFVITFIVQAFEIPTESMENTLLIGDYLLVDKLRYGGGHNPLLPYRPVRRGDIIVFHYPVNPIQHFVKRVVGVPGDRIRLINRQLYVNGVSQKEAYVEHTGPVHDVFRDEFPRVDMPPTGIEGDWWLQMRKLVEDNQLIVPEGNYFVMGDNRDDSKDSRYWGFVPQANIEGRPLVIYWSLRSFDTSSPGSLGTGGKLSHFIYGLTHLTQITRWDRTFQVVR